MLVLLNTLAWSLSCLSVPLLIARLFGCITIVTIGALVSMYIALGALIAHASVPRPVGAEPAGSEPHLTLCHPHGVICNGFMTLGVGYRTWSWSRLVAFGPPHFLVAAPLCYFGDFFCRLVSVRCSSSSRASVRALMRRRTDIYLYPGGLVEAARHSYDADVVDVGSRGAIRLALEHGYAVRVAFAFGERKTAHNLQGLWRARLWLAKRGVPAVLPFFMPLAKTPTVALSPTIQFPAVTAPTDDDVERWHSEYVAALRALHARYKAPDDVLIVHDEYRHSTRATHTATE
jgi:hypothetical protein